MADTAMFVFTKSISSYTALSVTNLRTRKTISSNYGGAGLFKYRSSSCFALCVSNNGGDVTNQKSRVHYDSLRVLEWDKLCDTVSSFAGTPFGREATKTQLWSSLLDRSFTFNDTLALLHQTNAAVRMHNHGSFSSALDFTRLGSLLVDSSIQKARRSSPVNGNEALAVATMLQFVQELQLTLKAAIKEDADWYNRFMPLSQMIMDLVANPSLVKLIQQVIVLRQLMDSLARNETSAVSNMEVSNIDGRWCIKSVSDQQMNITGLLMARCIQT